MRVQKRTTKASFALPAFVINFTTKSARNKRVIANNCGSYCEELLSYAHLTMKTIRRTFHSMEDGLSTFWLLLWRKHISDAHAVIQAEKNHMQNLIEICIFGLIAKFRHIKRRQQVEFSQMNIDREILNFNFSPRLAAVLTVVSSSPTPHGHHSQQPVEK